MSFSQWSETMVGEAQPDTLSDWAGLIGEWHELAFPWANASHVLDKLGEERAEALQAWAREDRGALADELADCLVCVIAAMAREGIDLDQVLSSKFERVRAKYDRPQPPPVLTP